MNPFKTRFHSLTSFPVLAALALATLSLGPSVFADGATTGGSDKFASCVQSNGGQLPDLTADQKAAKKDCWQNNSGDKSKAKECVQALNLPTPDAKTKAAMKMCKAEWKKQQSNG